MTAYTGITACVLSWGRPPDSRIQQPRCTFAHKPSGWTATLLSALPAWGAVALPQRLASMGRVPFSHQGPRVTMVQRMSAERRLVEQGTSIDLRSAQALGCQQNGAAVCTYIL